MMYYNDYLLYFMDICYDHFVILAFINIYGFPFALIPLTKMPI